MFSVRAAVNRHAFTELRRQKKLRTSGPTPVQGRCKGQAACAAGAVPSCCSVALPFLVVSLLPRFPYAAAGLCHPGRRQRHRLGPAVQPAPVRNEGTRALRPGDRVGVVPPWQAIAARCPRNQTALRGSATAQGGTRHSPPARSASLLCSLHPPALAAMSRGSGCRRLLRWPTPGSAWSLPRQSSPRLSPRWARWSAR